MEPLEQVTVMITLIRQLEEILEKENRALKAMTMADFEALQPDKALLTEAYEIEMRKLRQNPQILGSLDSSVRQALDDAVRQLQATSRRNAHALEAARVVIERLVEKLGQNAQSVSRGGRYGQSGTPVSSRGQVIAVAFNHAI